MAVVNTEDDMYLTYGGLRIAGLDAAGFRGKTNTVKIAVPVVLTSSILMFIGTTLAWLKFKGTGYFFTNVY